MGGGEGERGDGYAGVGGRARALDRGGRQGAAAGPRRGSRAGRPPKDAASRGRGLPRGNQRFAFVVL